MDLIKRTRRCQSRVRTGCSICRSKRVKCDEQKPSCRRCISRGLKCFGLGYGGEPRSYSIIAALPSNLPKFNSSADVLDILQLLPLTNAQAAGKDANDNIAAFIHARGTMLLSFVAYLPATAGHDIALDGAVRCVAMILRETYRKRELLATASSKQESLPLYTAVLGQLQDALYDSRRLVSAEILCATQLLCFFEYLRGETGPGSVEHSQGASRLIQYRGSQRFSTEFEKALLTNQMAIISTIALLNNKVCFFHTKDWLLALEGCIVSSEQTTDRSELVLYHQIYTQPPMKMVVDVTNFVLQQPSTKQANQERLQLLQHLTSVRLEYLKWVYRLQMMKPMRNSASNRREDGSMVELWPFRDIWIEILSLARVVVAIMDRLHVALGGWDALEHELASQKTAADLKLLDSQRCRTVLRQMNTWLLKPAYESILNTADEWEAFSRSNSSEVIPVETFARWLKMGGIRFE